MRKPVVALLLVAIVGVAGVGAWMWAGSRAEERFCTTGLAFREVDGRAVALEDQGEPGPDPCDGPREGSEHDVVGDRGEAGGLVLGFDCAVRDRDGEEVAIAEPNRADGTCGQDDP